MKENQNKQVPTSQEVSPAVVEPWPKWLTEAYYDINIACKYKDLDEHIVTCARRAGAALPDYISRTYSWMWEDQREDPR